ncbi:MAG: hypothetical protein GY795_30280 [Desulfobacterales bacterium]|nr:hypothetical protein [Desulfobacterales bacterium]
MSMRKDRTASYPSKSKKIRINMAFDPENLSLEAVINQTLEIILKKCNNNKAQAASLLKVHRNIFYRRKI